MISSANYRSLPATTAEDLEVSATTSPQSPASKSSGAAHAEGLGPSQLTLVRLALAVGLVAVALGVVLSRSPLTVAGTNGVPAKIAVSFIRTAERTCQAGGTLPQGTRAIRVSLSANTGPKVAVKVYSGATLVTEGEHEAGWGVDETVTVPVTRVRRTISEAIVCTSVGVPVEPLQINGSTVRSSSGAVAAVLRLEYLRPGRRSWLSLASATAQAMGLDHAPNGAWGAYLVIAALLAMAALALRLLLRELTARMPARREHERTLTSHRRGAPKALGALLAALRRVPRAGWTCALVASLSAVCWSLVSPPFQVPDEPSHFAYVQLLAETGR